MNLDIRVLYLWLNDIKGVGPVAGNRLIEYFKGIKNIYFASEEEILNANIVSVDIAKRISMNKDLDKYKKIIEYCDLEGIGVCVAEDNIYPNVLKAYKAAPNLIYYIGNIERIDKPIAVVGSRRCDEYGKRISISLAKSLAKAKVQVISGMAKGIDGYAQTVSVNDNNFTIAVLGTGINICYPAEHKRLKEKIQDYGVVLSQFPIGTSNIRGNFIKRNEFIAMLSDKIVIVQGDEKCGSLHTAKYAQKIGVEIYAVPGEIDNRLSFISGLLIESGAKPYLGFESLNLKNNCSEKIILNKIENEIIEVLRCRGKSLEEISIDMNIEITKLEDTILELEMKNVLIQKAGKWFLTTEEFFRSEDTRVCGNLKSVKLVVSKVK